jgi:chorismate mutase
MRLFTAAVLWSLHVSPMVLGCAPQAPAAPSEERSARAAPSAPDPPPAVADLLRLMKQRLLLMHDVARWKWTAKRPIADPERERTLLRDIESRCLAHGVEPELARAFFTAQMDAGKMVQEEDYRRWEAEQAGPFPDAPDLASSIRPKIDALTDAILDALAAAKPLLKRPDVATRLTEHVERILVGDGISSAVRAHASAPLRSP